MSKRSGIMLARSISSQSRKDVTMGYRFWQKVNRESSSECWNWLASTNKDGYGQFWIGDTFMPAHCFSWWLIHGSIPKDRLVLHTCDNRACVNPVHLYLGTQSDNMRDRSARTKYSSTPINPARGSAASKSRLTENDVVEIRRLASAGVKQNLLAKMFLVSAFAVSEIVRRRSWTHV